MAALENKVLAMLLQRGRDPTIKDDENRSLAIFDSSIETLPSAVYYKTTEGRYIACNTAFQKLLNKPNTAIIGYSDFDLFPGRLASTFFQWDSEIIHSRTDRLSEVRLPVTGGDEINALLNVTVFYGKDNTVAGTVGTIIDVTADRQEERERSTAMVMAAAAEMAIQTIEGMIDPVIILSSTGNIERVNRGYAELIGLSRPIIGQDLSSLFLDFSQLETNALLDRCKSQGRVRDLSARVLDANGKELPVLANISLLRDSQRAIDGYVLAIRDVSSLMEAHQRLLENERTLDAIINASEDAVFLLDKDGIIRSGNRAMAVRYGQTPQSLIGKRLADLSEAGIRESREHFLQEIFTLGKPGHLEYEEANRVLYNSGFPIFGSDGLVREVAVYSYDITKRKQGERLQRTLYSISEAAFFAHDMQTLFRIVHRIVGRLVPADSFIIALHNSATDTFDCPYHVEEGVETLTEQLHQETLGNGLLDHLIRTGRALLLKAKDIDRLRTEGVIKTDGLLPREWLGVPLRNGENKIVGALIAQIKREGLAYSDEDRKVLSFVSSQIAMAIERKLNEEELRTKNELLKRLTDGTILALAKAVELRDPYTAGHQQRVARLSEALARELSLPEERIEAIRIAALLHDVGKICVPLELLSKPGQLSKLEFQFIRQHPLVSSDILKSIEFPYPIARYVRDHHEKLDGSGYPNGLHGDEIDLESRIICVADVVDAMVSHRPYRPSRGLELALNEIRDYSSKLYDADVAAACIRLFEKQKFDFLDERELIWQIGV